MPELEDAVAVVSGGGSGIGESICLTLATHGAKVAVTDIDLAAARGVADRISQEGGQSVAFQHDVRNWSSAQEVVGLIERQLGPIGILANNAGVSRRAPLLEMEEEEWDWMLDINLKGTYLMSRAVLPGMAERRRGRVINTASVSGKRGTANFSHYCASKFGVIGLTQSLAEEFAPFDITVNAVCPGLVATPLHHALLAEMEAGGDVTADEAWNKWLGMIPLGRAQEAIDIAEVVAFLASDRARNMTGGAYNVDGGMIMS